MSENINKNNGLSKKQLSVAEMLANPDVDLNKSQICEKCGISRSTFYKWLKKQEFISYVASLVDKYTDSELSGVWKALVKKCEKGDVPAMKLYFELKGKYKSSVDFNSTVIFVDDVNE